MNYVTAKTINNIRWYSSGEGLEEIFMSMNILRKSGLLVGLLVASMLMVMGIACGGSDAPERSSPTTGSSAAPAPAAPVAPAPAAKAAAPAAPAKAAAPKAAAPAKKAASPATKAAAKTAAPAKAAAGMSGWSTMRICIYNIIYYSIQPHDMHKIMKIFISINLW